MGTCGLFQGSDAFALGKNFSILCHESYCSSFAFANLSRLASNVSICCFPHDPQRVNSLRFG